MMKCPHASRRLSVIVKKGAARPRRARCGGPVYFQTPCALSARNINGGARREQDEADGALRWSCFPRTPPHPQGCTTCVAGSSAVLRCDTWRVQPTLRLSGMHEGWPTVVSEAGCLHPRACSACSMDVCLLLACCPAAAQMRLAATLVAAPVDASVRGLETLEVAQHGLALGAALKVGAALKSRLKARVNLTRRVLLVMLVALVPQSVFQSIIPPILEY